MSIAGRSVRLRDLPVVLGATAVLGLLLRLIVLDACRIPSASMQDTLLPGDHVLINRLATPARGDVLAFVALRDDGERTLLVKRCLAVPGDTVGVGLTPGEVRRMGTDEYFMVGDNREESVDSRTFGPVSRPSIIGRAVFVYWSVDPATGGTPGIRWSRIGTVVR